METEIKVPLTEFVKQVASEAAREAAKICLDEHRKQCQDKIERRLRELEQRERMTALVVAKLIGAFIGSSLLGGGAAVGIAKALGIV